MINLLSDGLSFQIPVCPNLKIKSPCGKCLGTLCETFGYLMLTSTSLGLFSSLFKLYLKAAPPSDSMSAHCLAS